MTPALTMVIMKRLQTSLNSSLGDPCTQAHYLHVRICFGIRSWNIVKQLDWILEEAESLRRQLCIRAVTVMVLQACSDTTMFSRLPPASGFEH